MVSAILHSLDFLQLNELRRKELKHPGTGHRGSMIQALGITILPPKPPVSCLSPPNTRASIKNSITEHSNHFLLFYFSLRNMLYPRLSYYLTLTFKARCSLLA